MPVSQFIAQLPEQLRRSMSDVEDRLVCEYGAIFVASGGVTPPDRVIFRNESEVAAFQSRVNAAMATLGGLEMELQSEAMTALLNAVSEAESRGLSITPRGPDSAKRSYEQTVHLWLSRVEPALVHWVAEGSITPEVAQAMLSASTFEQVERVLRLEKEGIWFAKDLSKSILYSVAPPGASQHLAMLAFDVAEFQDASVRDVLALNGWFQTVVSDLPHFTYLGRAEADLPGAGLKSVRSGDQRFWIPDL